MYILFSGKWRQLPKSKVSARDRIDAAEAAQPVNGAVSTFHSKTSPILGMIMNPNFTQAHKASNQAKPYKSELQQDAAKLWSSVLSR